MKKQLSLSLALLGLSQVAMSHPTLYTKSATEGSLVYNAIVSTHGCTSIKSPVANFSGPSMQNGQPPIGTVSFWPTGDNASNLGPIGSVSVSNQGGASLYTLKTVNGGQAIPANGTYVGVPSVFKQFLTPNPAQDGAATSLSAELVSSAGGSTALTTLGGKFVPINGGTPYTSQGSILETGTTNAVGSWATGGAGQDPKLDGPLNYLINLSGVWLNPNTCAKYLVVHAAQVDTCLATRSNAAINGQNPGWNNIFAFGPGTQLPWTPDGVSTNANGGINFTVARDLINNPLPSSCNAANEYAVHVIPSNVELNTYLKIPGVWNDQN
jgi:hypothetical protein